MFDVILRIFSSFFIAYRHRNFFRRALVWELFLVIKNGKKVRFVFSIMFVAMIEPQRPPNNKSLHNGSILKNKCSIFADKFSSFGSVELILYEIETSSVVNCIGETLRSQRFPSFSEK